METCGQPGYVFRDFCLKQGQELLTGYLFLDDKQPVRMFYECLKQGIKNRNSVLNRAGKSAIFVLNRVRV